MLPLDMPPSQGCPKGTHHEVLAYAPDLDALEVAGSIGLSQDRPERNVRA